MFCFKNPHLEANREFAAKLQFYGKSIQRCNQQFCRSQNILSKKNNRGWCIYVPWLSIVTWLFFVGYCFVIIISLSLSHGSLSLASPWSYTLTLLTSLHCNPNRLTETFMQNQNLSGIILFLLFQLFQKCLIKVLNIDLWKCYLAYVRETKSSLQNFRYRLNLLFNWAINQFAVHGHLLGDT